MDSLEFKKPAGASVNVATDDDMTVVELEAIWGTGGVAVELEAIWGTGGVALEGELHNLGQDSIELFEAVG